MQQFELLAPGGDPDSIKAAVLAGADAIYCGLDKFNARNRATNLSFSDLLALTDFAHQHGCKIFLTLNIIILESEFTSLFKLLNKLVNSPVDGIILQDSGLFYLIKKYFPTLDVHASTQVTLHNEGQVRFYHQLGASRVNLSRELNIAEIKQLTQVCAQHQMQTEVFVHGSYCIAFSGLCYISSVKGGNSGNRGRCSQPCRDQYQTTAVGSDFPLNLKDNSAFHDLPALADAGVYSLKLEGRMKKYDYVHTVVDRWRRQLDTYLHSGDVSRDDSELHQVFNRSFSNGYLKGEILRDMYTENARDHALAARLELKQTHPELVAEQERQLKEKSAQVKSQIDAIALGKKSIQLTISGKLNEPLRVSVSCSTQSFELTSESQLKYSESHALTAELFEKRFKGINSEAYQLEPLAVAALEPNLFIPFKELTQLRNQIVVQLNGGRPLVHPVELPKLASAKELSCTPRLAVLIGSPEDLLLVTDDSKAFYYQLPEHLSRELPRLVTLFQQNSRLTPWFPSILMGDDYEAAKEFLLQVQPERIVTNNSGVAYLAKELEIDWLAGPYLNCVNSFSLQGLKEEFGCVGAFISNELNARQIQQINPPEEFELHYSIYHPILLMESRHCFIQQTAGCNKEQVDEKCLRKCDKLASMTNLKQENFYVNKLRGSHNTLYNSHNFLNTEIVQQLAGKFSGMMIDLRAIHSETELLLSKDELIPRFNLLLEGSVEAAEELHSVIVNTSCGPYQKGL